VPERRPDRRDAFSYRRSCWAKEKIYFLKSTSRNLAMRLSA
jgi:hypothetical protein